MTPRKTLPPKNKAVLDLITKLSLVAAPIRVNLDLEERLT
jgi:hypothetical protein